MLPLVDNLADYFLRYQHGCVINAVHVNGDTLVAALLKDFITQPAPKPLRRAATDASPLT